MYYYGASALFHIITSNVLHFFSDIVLVFKVAGCVIWQIVFLNSAAHRSKCVYTNEITATASIRSTTN